MATDLLIGAIQGARLQDIDVYLTSLDRSGFNGERIMLVYGIEHLAQRALERSGFEVIHTKFSDEYNFQTSRYLPALDLLGDRRGTYRHVIWTDVYDVVFQTNPAQWLEQNIADNQLVVAKEGWLIKNQGTNDWWIKTLLPAEFYNIMRENEVWCAGTIAGTEEGIIDLFRRMRQVIVRGIGTTQGIDQGLFNIVARQMDRVLVPEPEDAWVSTVGIFLAPSDKAVWTIAPPRTNWLEGTVLTPETGKLFSIQHQYNRHDGHLDPHGTWRTYVERNFR